MSSSLIGQRNAQAKATELHAKASPDFAAKLLETQALLQRAADEFSPVTQASSLGAEDVVITHLINRMQLNLPVFVLETGALHTETLALLERTQAHSQAPIQVFRPVQSSVMAFVRERGQDAMYQSIELRKACCQVRKLEPLGRALQGQLGWITGLRQEQSTARAQVPLIDESEVASKNLYKFNPLARWTWGDCGTTSRTTRWTTTRCTTSFFPASVARLARVPSAWAKSFAPAAGGGKTRRPRSAGCTSKLDGVGVM